MMFAPTISRNFRIVNVTSTTTAQTLQKLLETALALKSAPANSLPDKSLVQVAFTPSVAVEVSDPITNDPVTISTRTVYPLSNALTQLAIKNAATVSVELYYE